MLVLTPLQRQALKASKLYRAVAILLGGLPKSDRKELDDEISGITTRTKRELQAILEARTKAVRQLDVAVGFLAQPDEYVRLVDKAMGNEMSLYMIPKALIDSRLFKDYSVFYPRWKIFPPHTRFGIDARGEVPFTGRTVEWRLLEAALFEDMALLWNDCLVYENNSYNVMGDARIPLKRFGALKRSAVRAVFALLEGYVNGIGTCLEWTTDLSTYSKDARELVMERSDDGRQRFKRFRDKVMQYPRIALGCAVSH